MALIGYGRVSTKDQRSASQVAELDAAGCERVFVDHGESSRLPDRPEWTACLDYLRPGDVLVFTAMSRIAGGFTMMLDTLQLLRDRGVKIKSLTEPEFDTTTAMGAYMERQHAAFIQFRLDIIRENTMRGLRYARSQGRVGGRPTVMTPERTEQAVKMFNDGMPVTRIARVLGVGASSVSRALTSRREVPAK